MDRDQSRDAVLSRLHCFSQALGWGELQKFRKTLDDSRAVVWYVAGDSNGSRTHCALQINEYPLGSSESFSAAVHCIRYRICSGWHSFVCAGGSQAAAEADRLRSWLSREWFTTAERRRAYRLAHPECTEYTWKKLREVGEPRYP